jgi:putative glycosyltransferase
MDLSVVTTLYRSQPYVEEFYRRICAAALAITPDFELILVNDGSPDGALEAAVALFQRDERVRVIDLSRNFGHHRAIMTGLAHARGDLVFLIDCDLEEEPELLSRFHARLVETGADVIYGTQVSRKGGIWERISGAVFYRVFRALSSAPVPKNLVTVRLMTRRYVHALTQHRDREIFLAGLWQITGFQQVALPIVKLWRRTSSYSWRHKVAILVNAVTSFSTTPLVWIFYVGISMLLLSSAGALYLIVQKLFFGTYLFGWPSLIVSIWMIGGFTIFSIGIIGIYLSKIFAETKDRPYTIIREVYQRCGGTADDEDAGRLRHTAALPPDVRFR